jgi:voltage-gated potassium channel Kch
MKPQIIVCSLGKTGFRIFNLLRHQGAEVIGISDRPIPGALQPNIIVGNLRAASTLVSAKIRTAQTLVLAGNDDALNLAILTQAKVLNPNIRIINRLFNQTLGDRLDLTLSNHFSMSVSTLAAPVFAFAALRSKASGHLLLFEQTWPIREEIIEETHPWFGMKLSELWNNRDRMLIHYLPARGEIDLVSALLEGGCLQKGDRLIIGDRPKIRQKRSFLRKKLVKAIANLPKYQRYLRSVVIVICFLFLTIFLATMTYVSVNYNTSIVDAFSFSVGTITGVGGEDEILKGAPNIIKIFTAAIALVGAGIVGICYALINDFILGSRLKQFLDAAKVPTRNHYIVCGLGEVGIKVVRQLHAQGYDVVVIEPDDRNRFLHIARSLGVPIILEDASLSATLKTANIYRAAALITVTSNDTTNLEIALTAKALSPQLATIVRSQDSQFAHLVQEVFKFESVLSPTELATHSFVAAALGGRILGNGITDDLLWVALAVKISFDRPFCDKLVKEVAIQTDFVPLYLETKNRTIHGWQLLEAYLQPEDILYLTMPAHRLEQLWRDPPTEKLILK